MRLGDKSRASPCLDKRWRGRSSGGPGGGQSGRMQNSLWRQELDVGWGSGKEEQDQLLGVVPRYVCCQRLAPQVGMLGTTN